MSTQTSTLIDVHPAGHEVAIVPTAPGQGVRLHLSGEERMFRPVVDDSPHVLVLPGDRALIGWGWSHGWYGSLAGIRNGHHPVDRDAWHAACKAVQGGGIAYVTYTLREYYGQPRWIANGYRWEPVEQAGAAA